jgi:hypothetical protein
MTVTKYYLGCDMSIYMAQEECPVIGSDYLKENQTTLDVATCVYKWSNLHSSRFFNPH